MSARSMPPQISGGPGIAKPIGNSTPRGAFARKSGVPFLYLLKPQKALGAMITPTLGSLASPILIF